MTQSELDIAVATSTGESLSTVRALGFGPLLSASFALEPEELELRLDCPMCGRAIALPPDRTQMTTCPRCDVEFEYTDDELYAADAHESCDHALQAA